jgi:hypothetical protein
LQFKNAIISPMTTERSEGQSQEQLWGEKYTITTQTGGEEFMDTYRDELVGLHTTVYKPIIPDDIDFGGWSASSVRIFDQLDFEEYLEKPTSTFVLLHDKSSNNIAGFTHAYPSAAYARYPDAQQERESLGLSIRAYRERQERTATVGHTLIQPEHRATGSWSRMMDTLEQELAKRDFAEMIRIVRQEDNYADKVRSRYQGRIVTEIPDQPSYVGLQTYFRISLPRRK